MLCVSEAFRTWRPGARNTTNGTRSKSTERISNVASNGIILLAFVRVEDLNSGPASGNWRP